MPAFVGLVNPKSASNVGAILRACGCFAIDGVVFQGNRIERAVKFCTDTQNVADKIPFTREDDLIGFAKQEGLSVVCIELVEDASVLHEFEHPENALYVFGPEDGSIPQTLIDQADDVIYIATHGSLNLAATANVVLYDRSVKVQSVAEGNLTIKNSRDNNNRLIKR